MLLVGHGSAHYPDAGRAMQAHAARLRPHFAQVAVGLLNGEPAAAPALASLHRAVVHMVPCFMENGWFVRNAVPAALGLQGRSTSMRNGNQIVRSCAPVGVHDGIPAVIEACVARRHADDPAALTVLLVGHGSARSPGRPMALHRHGAALARRRCFADVRVAFLEEPPLVADALRALADATVGVVGCFMGEGGHVRLDLPNLLAAERRLRGPQDLPVLDLGSIGDAPGLAQLILEQVAGWSDVPPE